MLCEVTAMRLRSHGITRGQVIFTTVFATVAGYYIWKPVVEEYVKKKESVKNAKDEVGKHKCMAAY